MESERPSLFPSGASTEAVPPDRLHADLVCSASDAIIAMDQRGHIIFWNDSAEALLGGPADEIVGGAAARLTPEDRAREQQRFARATFDTAQQAAMEAVYLHKNGTRI